MLEWSLVNLGAWAVQAAALVAVGVWLPMRLRLGAPRVRLVVFRALLVACIALPLVQPWEPAPAPVVPEAAAPPPDRADGRGSEPAVSARRLRRPHARPVFSFERVRAAVACAAVGRDCGGRSPGRRRGSPRVAGRRSGVSGSAPPVVVADRREGGGHRGGHPRRRHPRVVPRVAARAPSRHVRPPPPRRPGPPWLHRARAAAAAGDCLPRVAARAAAGLAPRARRRTGARAPLVPPGDLVAGRADSPERGAVDRPRGRRPRRRSPVVPARAARAGRGRRRPAAPAGALFPGSRSLAEARRDVDGRGVYVPPATRRFRRARLRRSRDGRLGCRPGVPVAGRRSRRPASGAAGSARTAGHAGPTAAATAACGSQGDCAGRARATAAAAVGAASGLSTAPAPTLDEATLKQNIQANPKDTANYFVLARLYEKAGDLAKAEATLEAAVKAAPKRSQRLPAVRRIPQPERRTSTRRWTR